MQVELTKISEKGQVVIPSALRSELGIKKSDQFMIFGEGNTLILKKIELSPLKKSLSELTAPLQKVISEQNFSREDLKQVLQNVRRKN